MAGPGLIIPKGYKSKLNIRQTEQAIKYTKDLFQQKLAVSLNLERISAPLFVQAETGLNDDLSGTERPVQFDIKSINTEVQIVHSLAKWKRSALARYDFKPGEGLYTDMNAIRRDEELDNIHSVYVDQWDWEKIILPEQRNIETLKSTVRTIMKILCETKQALNQKYSSLNMQINEDIFFITSEELLRKYPDLSPKERENKICKEYKSVFIMQIGDKLSNGIKHDERAPDYDDWTLNGDILIWYEPLQIALEMSSMGIRVNPAALDRQLTKANCEERRNLPFHKQLLEGKLPQTMGGGIGQSRMCMLLLEKAHIGEVQASVWSDEMIAACAANGINLL